MENIISYEFYNKDLDVENDSVEEFKGFIVNDLKSADWALRKIKQNNDTADERIEYAKEEIERLKDFISSEEKSRDNSNSYLESLLEVFLRERRIDDDKFKIKTATGTVSTRKSKSWNYDEDKLLTFLKQNEMNEYIRIKEEVNKVDFKKSVLVSNNGLVTTKDGEIIDGVSVVEDEKLTIKLI